MRPRKRKPYVLTTPEGRRVATLEGQEIAVGREPSVDLVLDEPSVSKRHARLLPWGAGYKIVDQGSSNGTFVNDEAVSQVALEPGDLVRIGSTVLRFARAEEPRRPGNHELSVGILVGGAIAAVVAGVIFVAAFVLHR